MQKKLSNKAGATTLSRNINTLYYERLLMSKEKAPVIKEMKEKTQEFQQDKLEYIKSPVVMEFLGLPSDSSLKESKLESAIIDNLEKFLMEINTSSTCQMRKTSEER
jgi:predicted nuclease of restriction endonuclease-like (RecB) superfamily